MKTTKKKLKSLKKLKKQADDIFSHWIRERDKHICYTCGKFLDLAKSQNGHYISRTYLSLRYDERNCHCQGAECNIFKKGNLAVYGVKLEQQYGYGILQDLEQIKHSEIGNTREFLNQVIQKYGHRRNN